MGSPGHRKQTVLQHYGLSSWRDGSQIQLAHALVALNPESDTFLDVKAVKHVPDLSRLPVPETEYKVAKQFSSSQKQSQSL